MVPRGAGGPAVSSPSAGARPRERPEHRLGAPPTGDAAVGCGPKERGAATATTAAAAEAAEAEAEAEAGADEETQGAAAAGVCRVGTFYDSPLHCSFEDTLLLSGNGGDGGERLPLPRARAQRTPRTLRAA